MELSVKAGLPFTMTVVDPGTHVPTILGIHGIGVKTPKAAAVAEATVGLAKLLHIPKDMIFTNGLLSITVAIGCDDTFTKLVGKTVNVDGIAPKEHIKIAPLHTQKPIYLTPLLLVVFAFHVTIKVDTRNPNNLSITGGWNLYWSNPIEYRKSTRLTIAISPNIFLIVEI